MVIDEQNQKEHPCCPLCKSVVESEKSFERHLACHLQELALFVLPCQGNESKLKNLRAVLGLRQLTEALAALGLAARWINYKQHEDAIELRLTT